MNSSLPAARPASTGKPPRPPCPPACACACDLHSPGRYRPIIRVHDGIQFFEGIIKPAPSPPPPAPYSVPPTASSSTSWGVCSVTSICVNERDRHKQVHSRARHKRPILHNDAFAAILEAIDSGKPRLVLKRGGAAATPAPQLLRRLVAHEEALCMVLAGATSLSEPLRYSNWEQQPPFGDALGEAWAQVEATWVAGSGEAPPRRSCNRDHAAVALVVPKGDGECPAEEDAAMVAVLQAVKNSLRKPACGKFVVEEEGDEDGMDMMVQDFVGAFKRLLREAKEVAESVRRRAGDPKGKGVMEG